MLEDIVTHGDQSDSELVEQRHVTVTFTVKPADAADMESAGLAGTVTEMRKVFFTSEPNRFGHSYRAFWRGPGGRSDLSDIVELLRDQPATKRALLALVDPLGMKVPCLNAIHFLIRSGRLEVSYFARGQDIYLKFCADAMCVHELALVVAQQLNLEVGPITGTISSAHIYSHDIERVTTILNRTPQLS